MKQRYYRDLLYLLDYVIKPAYVGERDITGVQERSAGHSSQHLDVRLLPYQPPRTHRKYTAHLLSLQLQNPTIRRGEGDVVALSDETAVQVRAH